MSLFHRLKPIISIVIFRDVLYNPLLQNYFPFPQVGSISAVSGKMGLHSNPAVVLVSNSLKYNFSQIFGKGAIICFAAFVLQGSIRSSLFPTHESSGNQATSDNVSVGGFC